MKRIIILSALLLPMATLAADVGYRIVHPDGTVEFTDDPRRGGEQIELAPAPTVPAYVAPQRPQRDAAREQTPRDTTTYQSLSITSPEEDQVIWFDGTGVNVSIALEPAIANPEHRIVIEMNGEAVAEGQGRRFNIPTVHRGTHTLHAKVVDGAGETLKRSEGVSFHFRQHSIQN